MTAQKKFSKIVKKFSFYNIPRQVGSVFIILYLLLFSLYIFVNRFIKCPEILSKLLNESDLIRTRSRRIGKK